MYNTHAYNDAPLNLYANKFISDYYAMRLGPPRLRLLRVKPSKCWIRTLGIFRVKQKCRMSRYGVLWFASERCHRPAVMQSIVHQCGHDYDDDNEDVTSYRPDWQPVTATPSHATPSNATYTQTLVNAFVYESQEDRKGECLIMWITLSAERTTCTSDCFVLARIPPH